MTMDDEKYNEAPSSRYWQAAARKAYAETRDDPDVATGTFTRKQVARALLADRLKEEHEQAASPEDRPASVYTDLLQGARARVDWDEIAEALLEDCEQWGEEDED
jgi:hypothetical protein